MKILLINSLANTEIGGGAEVILWEQIRGLRERGYDCVLLATSNTPGLSFNEIDGVKIWRAGIRNLYWPAGITHRPAVPLRVAWHALDSYNLLMQRYVRQVVTQERPNVASLHNLAGWSVSIYGTLTDLHVPIVQILHDHYLICVKSSMLTGGANCVGPCPTCRAFRFPHRRLTQKVRAVVGVSRFILERHKRMGYFAGVPIQRVIHNARDPKSLGIRCEERDRSYGDLRFGYIGALSAAKGVAQLASAFLSVDLESVTLWITGSGKPQYEKRLRDRFLDSRISFKGRMRRAAFFSQVDVVVVPSLVNEAFGLVVLEALAFGKPVIGSRRGGIPEMICDRYNGLLFDPGIEGDLERCIHAIYDDDALRLRLSANAAPSAAPFIDFEGWIDQYERVYRQVAR